MQHTHSFRTAYDCLPRQLPLALGRGLFGAVPVLHDHEPAIRDAASGPIAYAAGTQPKGASEFGNAAFAGDCFLKNVHTHDFITVVSEADTQTHRQTNGMNKISDRLKEARSRRGWNQVQLALAAGVSPGTIGNIESGARQAKGSLPQIAKALGISHDWLANGEGEMLDNQACDHAEGEPSGPSSQAALLALLFDKLDNDLVLRAQVFNKASQIIIDTIQGTDAPQTQEPAAQTPVKKQSV